eukprot:TRINITY_DN1531_c0_g1_i3.p1 TRINITY_DN1531_c0_g1~~TRINITY_DN1531_c0_g1_i3.p1  ORF type:complete len:1473 (-),score=521.78 TRINITY_DN1531_c0_g1_i3:70-4488(-)
MASSNSGRILQTYGVFLCGIFFLGSIFVASGNDLEGSIRCGNAACSSIVAEGRTTSKYMSGAYGLLSFNAGQDVLIYGKEGSGNTKHWSVEIQGARGFAPKSFIIVTKEINRDLKFEVPIHGKSSSSQAKASSNNETPQPQTTTAQTVDTSQQQQPPSNQQPNKANPVIDINPSQQPAQPNNIPPLPNSPPSNNSNDDHPSTDPLKHPDLPPVDDPMRPHLPLVAADPLKPQGLSSDPLHPTNDAALQPNVPPTEAPSKQNDETMAATTDTSSVNIPEAAPSVMNPSESIQQEHMQMHVPSAEPNQITQANDPSDPNQQQMNVPSSETNQMHQANQMPSGINHPSESIHQQQQMNVPSLDPKLMLKTQLPSGINNPSESVEQQLNAPSLDPKLMLKTQLPSGINNPSESVEQQLNVPVSETGQMHQAHAPSEPIPFEAPQANNQVPLDHQEQQQQQLPNDIPSFTSEQHEQKMSVEEPPTTQDPPPPTTTTTFQGTPPTVNEEPQPQEPQEEVSSQEDSANKEEGTVVEPNLAEFENDDFYKTAEDDMEEDYDENDEENTESKNKNLVNEVLDEFANNNSEQSPEQPPPENNPEGFHYARQESPSPTNNEDINHATPSTQEQEVVPEEIQHTEYIRAAGYIPHSGSEEANESVNSDSNDSLKFKDSSEEATMNFFDRLILDIYPSWVHDIFHVNGFEEVSPEYCLCMLISASTLCVIYAIKFLMEKTSRESPLKARLALLDKELFVYKNDNLIIKKQLESSSSCSSKANPAPAKTIIKQETPSHVFAELEQLKEEREKLLNDSYNLQLVSQEKSALEVEKTKYQSLYEQSQQELLEAETIVQECLEEKKAAKSSSSSSDELLKTLSVLEDQLNSQKQAVLKYENKVKKRDSELKGKIQELRVLRADAANAKLECDRLGSEKEGLSKRIGALEGIDKERDVELEALRGAERDLKALKVKLGDLKEDVEAKEAELEAKNTEIEVLNNTIGTLKCIAASAPDTNGSDGWGDFSETPSIDLVEELSRCKVDLKKASEACNSLSEQLTKVESERDSLQSTLAREKEDWEVAHKVKDQVLTEKTELEHKHSVLSNYFNQREAELQKQLGLQSARLNEAEQGSESSSKKMVSVTDELESYKSQLRTLKLEMEEMERSWKSQNASLEKKQHESWVTVRQEARRNAEAQNEMQTLRSKLTVTEAKILEKETEIKRVAVENAALRETIQNISSQPLNILKPEPIYPNGHLPPHLPSSSNGGGKSSGTPSLSSLEPPPPELPPLPFLPPPPQMMPLLPNQSIMDTHRPPPLGRRSPSRGGGGGGGGRYSRSPSPPPHYYNNNNNNRSFRDSSPGSRSDRFDDYSPSPPYHHHHRRQSSRERSPDRFSTRSDRSDMSHSRHHLHQPSRQRDISYRDTPPRESRHQYHRRSSNEFPGSGLDDEEEEHFSRSKRNTNRNRNSIKNSRSKNGPKTSSPMTDGRDLNI